MIWNVQYGDEFLQDLQGIKAYISTVLQESQIAENLVDRIMDAADSLDQMPERYRLYEKGRHPGIRTMAVGNYVVLYQLEQPKELVKILRVIYGGRDIEAQLNQAKQIE
jgi:toxin ParE1/3/4